MIQTKHPKPVIPTAVEGSPAVGRVSAWVPGKAMQTLCDRSHGFVIFSVRATRFTQTGRSLNLKITNP